MKIINNKVKVEMTHEEAKVIAKMIGPTSFDSRKKNFGLTDRESNLAELIYETLSNIGGKDDE